jgi:hypothetical protein
MVKIKFGHVMAVNTDFHAKNKKIKKSYFVFCIRECYSETLELFLSFETNRIFSIFRSFKCIKCYKTEFGSIEPN